MYYLWSALSTSPPSVEGRAEPRSPMPVVLSVFFFCLPVSSKDPCIPEPEFGKCVCTDPPPPTCMYEGMPPIHTSGGGESAHSRIPKFRKQEHKTTFSV